MGHWLEEETCRHAIGWPQLQHIGRAFRRLRGADPRDRPVGRHQPHEREARQLCLPRPPLLFFQALVALRSVGLRCAGVLRLVAAAIEAASPEPAPTTAPAIPASASPATKPAPAAEAAPPGQSATRVIPDV